MFTVNGSEFKYGHFLNALVSFLMIAVVIFFLVVKPLNAPQARTRRGQTPPDPTTKQCAECLSAIPIAARRCAFCASPVAEAATA